MEPVRARLISLSQDGERAQVVVVSGEGSQQRSVTRHLVHRGASWLGRNPDEAALACLNQAEKDLGTVQMANQVFTALAAMSVEKTALLLEKIKTEEALEKDELPFASFISLMNDAIIRTLAEVMAEVKRRLAESADMLRLAEEKVAQLRAVTPPYVTFVF